MGKTAKKIKSCPFCGFDEPTIMRKACEPTKYSSIGTRRIKCTSCGVSTRLLTTNEPELLLLLEKQSIKLWNQRK